jgi:UPF0271 protein
MAGAMFVDLNADVGEGCGQDAALMSLISSANIACGIHAGDVDSMREAVMLARDHGVAIGAHPSFPDREHFGRREMQLDASDVRQCIVAQIESLATVAAVAGTRLRHVKPHGALYNMAARERPLADAIARAVRAFDRSLVLFGLPGSELLRAGEAEGLRLASEGFADRAYAPDGSLVSRTRPGAVIHDPGEVVRRSLKIVTEGRVTAIDGSELQLDVSTLCVHGDTAGAQELTRRLRAGLEQQGIVVRAVSADA